MAIVEKDKDRIYVTLQPVKFINGKRVRKQAKSMTITDMSVDEVYQVLVKGCSGTAEKNGK